MKTIEEFLQGKKLDQNLCEDGLFLSEQMAVLIDGVTTGKWNIWYGKSGGLFAKNVLMNFLEEETRKGKEIVRKREEEAAIRAAMEAAGETEEDEAQEDSGAGEEEVPQEVPVWEMTPEDFVATMNRALPPEMQLVSARALDDRHPALMAMVQAADYRITLLNAQAAESCRAALPGFLAREEILAERKTKSGVKEVNIRPWIFELSMEGGTLHAVLALSETENCKPDMLVTALCADAGCEKPRFGVTRLGLLGRGADGQLAALETL